VAAAHHREAGVAVAVAYASHLLIDATTPQGVQFFWPLGSEKIYLDPGIVGHAAIVTVVIWTGCLGAVTLQASERTSLPLPGRG